MKYIMLLVMFMFLSVSALSQTTRTVVLSGDFILNTIATANVINVKDVKSAVRKERMFCLGIRTWYGTDYKNDIPAGVFSAFPTQDQIPVLAAIDGDALTSTTADNLDKWVFARVFVFIVNTHNSLDFSGNNHITSPFDPTLPEKYKHRMDILGSGVLNNPLMSTLKKYKRRMDILGIGVLNNPLMTTTNANTTLFDINAYVKQTVVSNEYITATNSEKQTITNSIRDEYSECPNWETVFYTSKETVGNSMTDSEFDGIVKSSKYNTTVFLYSPFDSKIISRIKKAFDLGKFIVVVFPSRADAPPIGFLKNVASYSSRIPFFIIGWTDEISNTIIVPSEYVAGVERLSYMHREIDPKYASTMTAIREMRSVFIESTGKPIFIHMRQFRETTAIWLKSLEFVPDGVVISAYGTTRSEFGLAVENFYKYDAPKSFKQSKIIFISIANNPDFRTTAESKAKSGGAIGMFYEFGGTGNDF